MRYNDTTSAMQVIGNLYINPSSTSLSYEYAGGTKTITLSSNTSWTVS